MSILSFVISYFKRKYLLFLSQKQITSVLAAADLQTTFLYKKNVNLFKTKVQNTVLRHLLLDQGIRICCCC
jgi:hypothetical protein